MLTMNMEDFPDILTPYDVMGILGIGKNKTYELLNQGIIKGTRLGKIWRIPKAALESLFDVSQLS